MMNDEIFPPGDIQRSSKPTVTWNFVEEAGRQTELKQPVSIREPVKNYIADFFLLRGGGTPHFR